MRNDRLCLGGLFVSACHKDYSARHVKAITSCAHTGLWAWPAVMIKFQRLGGGSGGSDAG